MLQLENQFGKSGRFQRWLSVSDVSQALWKDVCWQADVVCRMIFRLFDLLAAVLTGAPRVVVPEIEHGLAEMLHDVAAIEIDVFHQRPALIAVEDDMLMFPRGTPAFHDDANRVRRANRGVDDVRRNEESFPLPNQVINNAVSLPDADFDVALELVKIFLRIDLVKVVPGVWAFDHHDEKIPAIVKVTVADRRLEEVAVFLDPAFEIDGRLDGRCRVAGWFW